MQYVFRKIQIVDYRITSLISCYTTFNKDLRKMPMGWKCLAPDVNWFSFKIPDLLGTKHIGS